MSNIKVGDIVHITGFSGVEDEEYEVTNISDKNAIILLSVKMYGNPPRRVYGNMGLKNLIKKGERK